MLDIEDGFTDGWYWWMEKGSKFCEGIFLGENWNNEVPGYGTTGPPFGGSFCAGGK